jgi:FAD/FMN-containing dehydrogenase
METQKAYRAKRKLVVDQLKVITKTGGTIALSKRTSNLFRSRQKTKTPKLNFKEFNNVIRISKKNLTAEVEAATTYKDLVDETLQFGLIPAVVPQLATITIGGAVAGGGIEATSFRFGLVHETIDEMEILLSSGQIVIARADNKYRDLFYSVMGSYGTIGYILKLKVKLVRTQRFVKLSYYKFENADKFFKTIGQITRTGKYKKLPIDFMDGMVLGPNQLFLILANFTKRAPYTSNYKYRKQFYRSIPVRNEDYLTVRDFIWRWDSDWFWCSKNFGMENPFLRLLFGKLLLNSKAYWRMVGLDRKYKLSKIIQKLSFRRMPREFVIQDVQIPLQNCRNFFNFFNKEIGITPFWICPTKQPKKKQRYPFFPLSSSETYVNFGFWDSVQSKKSFPKNHFNRLVEKKVIKLGGHKGLYSDVFFTRKEFWNIYDYTYFQKLKEKYDPQGRLKDLYVKCVKG